MTFALHQGDCADVMRTMPDCSVDTVVTDPPYGLSNQDQNDITACLTAWLAGEKYVHGKSGFMGKAWDAFVPGPDMWREVYRVLKPGGYALVFAGTRTMDLMGLALRLAGFRLVDTVYWAHAMGFPKAASVGKLLDKAAGAEREVVSVVPLNAPGGSIGSVTYNNGNGRYYPPEPRKITTATTDAAKLFDGHYSALKPAVEPILVCMKPLDGTYAANALTWGVAGFNIDGTRIATNGEELGRLNHVGPYSSERTWNTSITQGVDSRGKVEGRWPANIILDGSEEVTACFPDTGKSTGGVNHPISKFKNQGASGEWKSVSVDSEFGFGYGDSGSASRFFQTCPPDEPDAPDQEFTRLFYAAKASRRERNAGLEGMEGLAADEHNLSSNACARCGKRVKANGSGDKCECGELRETIKLPTAANHHPTVKPLSLLRYLVRLTRTPFGGVVLDPFMGSGTTGAACMYEGRDFIGIDLEPDYVEIARRRIEYHAQKAMKGEKPPKVSKAKKAHVLPEAQPQATLFGDD